VKENIKCCPFCGSHEVVITTTEICHGQWIRCHICGAQGEKAQTRRDAILQWNGRYYDDQPSVIIDDTGKETK